MSDVNDPVFNWETPIDRRTLLGKAAVAGGLLAAGGLLTAGQASAGSAAAAGDVTAFFGQFGAISEQEGIRKYVFKGFNGDVDAVFAPITAPNLFVDRVRAEAKAGKGSIDVLVGLHGDFVTFQNEGLIRGVDDVARQIKTLPRAVGQAREARHQDPVLRPALPGDLRDGRKPGRPQVHAQGSQHRRAHLRAGVPVGQDDPTAARGRTGSGCPPARPV